MENKQVLLDFLVEWLTWAEHENPNSWYSFRHGLCHAIGVYLETKNIVHLSWHDLRLTLKEQFVIDNLDETFPFDQDEYEYCESHDIQHKDLNRLAWVKNTITRLQKELSVV